MNMKPHPQLPALFFNPLKDFFKETSSDHSSGRALAQLEASPFFVAILSILFIFSIEQSQAQGTWTPVATLAPHTNLGGMLLLSDGTAIVKTGSGGGGGIGNLWDKLTPDIHGSYVNGTWSTIAAMNDTRLYFSSQVLKDGRVFVAGGEYGSGGGKGETYNPLTNTWTMASSSGHFFSDANSEILPDGRVLEALVEGSLTGTLIFDPVSNTWGAGPTCNGIHNESVWVKLADNSILFVDRNTTNSERYIPSLNQWVVDATVPVSLYDPYGLETGSALLLPDGRAFFLGSPGNTAYYTPSGTSSPGTWAAGPHIPAGQGTPDAAAAMMVNGKILCAVSPAPSSFNVFPSPTAYYEFNYLTNSYTQVNAPTGGTTQNEPCYYTGMLDLPDGTVLYSDQNSSQYYIYTPSGTPLTAGKPAISNITGNNCTSFTITGTLFNGISEGASYGDDWQMNTNYPIVRLTSGTNVYYARTFNWNSTGVQRGSLPDTTQFTLPSGLPSGTYSLVVVANGIASDPVSFTTGPTLSSTLTPPDICSNTAFTYTPTSTVNGATFTWTRAAVAGISNAAITTPQTTNPNEILVNTTSSSVSVIYAYTITANGCSNAQQVTVIVNPSPSLSSTLTPGSICSNSTFTYTPTSTSGGAVFTWTRAAVAGISNPAVTVPQATDPNEILINTTSSPVSVIYAYVTSANGCSSNQAVTVVVNPSPTASISGTTTICMGQNTTLTASGGAGISYQWIKGAMNISGATNQTYTTKKAAAYKVQETNLFSCVSTSAATTVTVLSTPAATITPSGNLDICATGSVVLLANSGAGYTYQWQKKNINLAGETNQTYTATAKGNYKVIVTGSNGCSKTSMSTKVTNSCKEDDVVLAFIQPELKIFPNPAEDQTTIHFTLPNSSHVCIKVYDVSGKEIACPELLGGTMLNDELEQGDYSLQVSTNHFSKGVYLVTMITDSVVENVKLIVQ